MFRRFFFLLLILLQLQPALAVVPGDIGGWVQDIGHAVVHELGEGHHHDADGAVHADESSPASLHVHHDSGHHTVLLGADTVLSTPQALPALRTASPPFALPNPDLEGPRRPPKGQA